MTTLASLLLLIALEKPAEAAPTVGMSARIEQIILPGGELEVIPREDSREPLVLRIERADPHGTAFRYNLVYYGLEPGRYDLARYLRRKDGSPAEGLPAIPVEVRGILPAGHIPPRGPEASATPRLGNYRYWVALAGAAWIAGLAAIALSGRRKQEGLAAQTAKAATPAERLRPLIDAALAGKLRDDQRPELERNLIACWLERRGLDQLRPAEALASLKQDEEAGPILARLESWLHRPGGEMDDALKADLAACRNRPASDWAPRRDPEAQLAT